MADKCSSGPPVLVVCIAFPFEVVEYPTSHFLFVLGAYDSGGALPLVPLMFKSSRRLWGLLLHERSMIFFSMCSFLSLRENFDILSANKKMNNIYEKCDWKKFPNKGCYDIELRYLFMYLSSPLSKAITIPECITSNSSTS